MAKQMNTYIIGTGGFLPELRIGNDFFLEHEFMYPTGQVQTKSTKDIVAKFEEITGIQERPYSEDLKTSDMAIRAAQQAIADAQIDPETIDQIILAHNFGDVIVEDNFYDMVPNLAARVKGGLGIKNPSCIAYDILFGCPGWLQGVLQGHSFIQSGMAKRILVIGADTVAKVVEPHDIDSMLFSDGAGAVILEGKEEEASGGVLGQKGISRCEEELDFLKLGPSYNKDLEGKGWYLKMEGKKVFRFAYEYMPELISDCLRENDLSLKDVKYFLFHQANEKMLKLIVDKLMGIWGNPQGTHFNIPFNIHRVGNNSVATIPVLMDQLVHGKMDGYEPPQKGDLMVFASVGAGMHINCMVYKY
jgi:3-oxoacyl-[acyl-carrier-protein] synthase-3